MRVLCLPPTADELQFIDRGGTIVYRWSDGQAFPMIVRTETFGPGEKDFVIQLRLNGPDKAPLPAGKYVAEGWLTSMGAKVFDASVPFQVAWTY